MQTDTLQRNTAVSNLTAWIFLAVTLVSILLFQFIGIIIFIPVFIVSSTFFAISALNSKLMIITRAFPVLVFLIILIITRSFTSSFITLLLFLPAGIALSITLKKNGSFKTVAGVVFLATMAFFIITILVSVFEYEKSFDFRSYFSVFTTEYKNILGSIYDTLAQNEIYRSVLTTKTDFVYLLYIETIQTIPSVIVSVFGFVSVAVYWLTKYLFRLPALKGTEIAFSSYTDLKANRVLGYIYIGASIITMFSLTDGELVFFNTLTYILSLYLCYTGTACIGYFLKSRNIPAFVRVIIYILIGIICILPFRLSIFVSIIGVADAFLDLRRFMKERSDSRYL